MLLNNLHINVFNLMSRTNEAMNLSWHETCRFNCRLDVMFVIINNAGIMVTADVNVKNRLKKENVMMDLFGILVYVNVNVINHVMLQNI